MRVLKILGSLGMGGAERYVTRVIPLLKIHGIEVEVCALDPRGPLLPGLQAAEVAVHGTSFARWTAKSNAGYLLRVVNEIRQLIRRGRFDIVHSYLFWADVLGTAGARLAGCRRIIISRQALHAWLHDPRPIFHGLEQGSNLLAHELIANSQAVLHDVEKHERFRPRIRTVVYSGVDPDDYRPAPRTPGPLRLLTIGALSPRKGQEFAVRALKLVIESGVQATLTLVGRGPDEPMLRRMTAAAGLDDVVQFAGERMDPRPFLANADIFLFPSRQEGFASALLEAMACGLPAVATDVGGNAEALVSEEGGYIVPPGDPEAIARAILKLASSADVCLAMGEANRIRILSRFTLKASADRLADWYLHGPYLKDSGPAVPAGSRGAKPS
jgi:glycosyltransferase involved in cell wall biosynthesis